MNPSIFVLISQILIKQSYKFSEAKDGLIWYCARIAFFSWTKGIPGYNCVKKI